jgi:hypothetical protein
VIEKTVKMGASLMDKVILLFGFASLVHAAFSAAQRECAFFFLLEFLLTKLKIIESPYVSRSMSL